jgi:hypothetical protein
MRKLEFLAIAALAVSLAFIPAAVVHANQISVNVNGQAVTFVDQGPTIVDGRTLVPVAGVFQMLGFSTQWNEDMRQVTVIGPGYTIVITIDSNMFTTNDVLHTLDVPAQIIGDRTMLPIAQVLRTLGYEVSWDEPTSTVAITSPVAPPATAVVPPAVPDTESGIVAEPVNQEIEALANQWLAENISFRRIVNNRANRAYAIVSLAVGILRNVENSGADLAVEIAAVRDNAENWNIAFVYNMVHEHFQSNAPRATLGPFRIDPQIEWLPDILNTVFAEEIEVNFSDYEFILGNEAGFFRWLDWTFADGNLQESMTIIAPTQTGDVIILRDSDGSIFFLVDIGPGAGERERRFASFNRVG